MMTDRDVMVKADDILAQHSALTADYIIKQLGDVIDDHVSVENWCRIARAVDIIFGAKAQ